MTRDTARDTAPCDDCHGTGEKHPTGRGYMSHEIRDCETCGGSGEQPTGDPRGPEYDYDMDTHPEDYQWNDSGRK